MPNSPTDSWVKVYGKKSCSCQNPQEREGPFYSVGKDTCPLCETRETVGSYFDFSTSQTRSVVRVPHSRAYYILDPDVPSNQVVAQAYLAEFGWYSYLLLPQFLNKLLPDEADPEAQHILRIESRTRALWDGTDFQMTPHPNVSHGGSVCFGNGRPPNPSSELDFLIYLKNLFGVPGWENPYDSQAATRTLATSVSYKGIGDRQPWKELDLTEWAFAPGCHSFYSYHMRTGNFQTFGNRAFSENNSATRSPCSNCALTDCPANITVEQRKAHPDLYAGSEAYLPRSMPGSMLYLIPPLVDTRTGYLSHRAAPKIPSLRLSRGFIDPEKPYPALGYPLPEHQPQHTYTLAGNGHTWCYLADDHPLREELDINRAIVR
jgi:hypothetical protein